MIQQYKPGPKRVVTYDSIENLCEPTPITVDLALLKSTLDNIYQRVGYSPEEWRQSPHSQSSISLTYPDQIPQPLIDKYGEFVARFRLVGNEDKLKAQSTNTSEMFNMDNIVKHSYINDIAKQIVNYHAIRFPDSKNVLSRIHSGTLGTDSGFRLHTDRHATMRYHIVTDTNDFCFMGSLNGINSEEIKLVHIPADGRVWMLDTQTFHNAMNICPIWLFEQSKLTRTHLIFTFCNKPN
jgi:hypothetical protein